MFEILLKNPYLLVDTADRPLTHELELQSRFCNLYREMSQLLVRQVLYQVTIHQLVCHIRVSLDRFFQAIEMND